MLRLTTIILMFSSLATVNCQTSCGFTYAVPNTGGTTCQSLQASWGVTDAEFKAWNPSIDCSNPASLAGKAVCMSGPIIAPPSQPVGIPVPSSGAPTTLLPPAVVTTPIVSPANPINLPAAPAESARSYDPACNKFYTVVGGDSCWAIANQKLPVGTASVDEIVQWNKWLDKGCLLRVGDSLCVGGPSKGVSAPASSPQQPAAPANNGPTPRLSGTAEPSQCGAYYLVQPGDSCWAIEQRYALSHVYFKVLNLFVDDNCTNLWPGYYVCVKIGGG